MGYGIILGEGMTTTHIRAGCIETAKTLPHAERLHALYKELTRIIEEEKPDLVLLDVVLPSMDGFEVLTRMREKGITIPVIIVSNSGQPVEIDRGTALGAKDHLVKAEFNDWMNRSHDDFQQAADYVLSKNTELYQRLSK